MAASAIIPRGTPTPAPIAMLRESVERGAGVAAAVGPSVGEVTGVEVEVERADKGSCGIIEGETRADADCVDDN